MSFKSLLIAAVVLCSSHALAQSPAGKWAVTVNGPQGPFEVTYEFKVEAAGSLTGTVSNPAIGSVAVKQGKLADNRLSFAIDWIAPDGSPQALEYIGTVKAEEIELRGKWVRGGAGAPPEFTAVARRLK
jgi:hypothetical protein